MTPKRKKRRKAKHHAQPDLALETIDSYNQLPIDDAKFVKAYLTNGGNQLEAAQTAWPYLTMGSAAVAGSRAFRRLREIVAIHMDQRGLTLDKLITNITEGLTATQPVIIKRVKYKDGKIDEKFEEVAYADDFKTRAKFTEMALKLRGELIKQPEIVVIQPPPAPEHASPLSVEITPQTLDDFESLVMGQIRQQLLNSVNPSEAEAKN